MVEDKSGVKVSNNEDTPYFSHFLKSKSQNDFVDFIVLS